jgi:hypothetical protein
MTKTSNSSKPNQKKVGVIVCFSKDTNVKGAIHDINEVYKFIDHIKGRYKRK